MMPCVILILIRMLKLMSITESFYGYRIFNFYSNSKVLV